MFVLPATPTTPPLPTTSQRARSRSRRRRETPSPSINNSSLDNFSSAASFLSSSTIKADTHGQGAVLPPGPPKVEYPRNSQSTTAAAPTTRLRRSSSVTNAHGQSANTAPLTAGASLSPPAADPKSPEKKGHARRSSWQRRLSIGGSTTLSATSLDRLDGLQRKSSVSSQKSPQKQPTTSQADKSVVSPLSSDSIPVLPIKTYGIGSISATASTAGTPTSPAIATLLNQTSSPTDHFGLRTTSLNPSTTSSRPRQASLPRSPRKDESSEPRERRKLQKRTASSDTTRSKGSQDTTRSKGSQDTIRRKASIDITKEEKDPEKLPVKEKREKDKKTMLSRALQKAHTAVLLDNAQNFEGAIQAYTDACDLLRQVLIRSSLEDDRRKLDAIRNTYENRIVELQQLSPNPQVNGITKSLPARPMSDSMSDQSPQLIFEPAVDSSDDEDEPAVIETAIATRIVPDMSRPPDRKPELPPAKKAPPISVTPSMNVETQPERASNGGLILRLPSDETTERNNRFLVLESPMDATYMPPPLSPRRMESNDSSQPPSTPKFEFAPTLEPVQIPITIESQQQNSSGHESLSWLDTIDESTRTSMSSTASSLHSLIENDIFIRKHLRGLSTTTEAEFDAALDAAVEAAYDDGLEPLDLIADKPLPRRSLDPVAAALANVALARSRVKEVEREEAILTAHRRHLALRTQKDPSVRQAPPTNGLSNSYLEEDPQAEEEERILDEMMSDNLVEGFDFGLGDTEKEIKPAIPPQPARQSDSSSYSGRTWNTSTSSSRTTAGTSLSAVAEGGETASPVKPILGLPPLDEEGRPGTASETSSVKTRVLSSGGQRDSLRVRRLSGQNAKQLKIETSILPATREPSTAGPRLQQATIQVEIPPRSAHSMREDLQTLPSSVFKPPGSTLQQPAPQSYFPQSGSPMPSVSPGPESVRTGSPATPGLANVPNGVDGAPSSSTGGMRVPSRPQVRKNKSSISLKQRQMSVSTPDSPDATSIGTPLSMSFSNNSRKNLAPSSTQSTTPLPTFNFAPTGMAAATENNLSLSNGAMSLFESADIHSPYSPGTPNPTAQNAPIPIEPCPESYLLRPFWLMRCVYQTIAHPRGGYLTTRMFVPRDVWRVKGVKIKNVEEKISNCDLLTAALGRLAAVDTLDADAVLEEMQQLETVLDQAQASLTKKLGSDVGVQGVASLFKDAPASTTSPADAAALPDGAAPPTTARSASGTSGSKGYLSGWRKLRSKGSSVNLPTTATVGFSKDKAEATGWTMPTVPMTSLASVRFAKRDIRLLELGLEGPNRAYMGAVARLCDAVQVIDQIARQVEDPGLKLSSPTHVGLELCTRHASEFFGFYVCRFVLSDLGILMDKFIKRGSEWVLI